MAQWKVLNGEYVCALWNDGIYYVHEKIVRCKDCIYMSDDGLTTAWCNENCREVRPKDFCAWGEKSE